MKSKLTENEQYITERLTSIPDFLTEGIDGYHL